MKRLIILLSVMMISSAWLYAQTDVSHYQMKFDNFNELKVVDGVNVDYVCDPSRAGIVEFDAPRDLVSAFIFEPTKTKLTIKLTASETPYKDLPTLRVYSSYLTNVTNDGDSLVRVLSVAEGPKFNCRVTGNGSISVRNVKANDVSATILAGKGVIVIYGECSTANLKVAGAGQIQADELKASVVSCSSTGVGSIHCYAVEQLSYGGLSGKIYYRGTPELKKRFLAHVALVAIDN